MSRLPHLASLLLLSTCTPARDDAGVAPVRARRDADLLDFTLPTAWGDPGSRLGTTVTHCDGEFMASGVSGLVWPESNLLNLVALAPQATVLSCSDTAPAAAPHVWYAGGPGGLWLNAPFTPLWRVVLDAGISSIERHPTQDTQLVVRGPAIEVFGVANGGLQLFDARFARWGPGGASFVGVKLDEARLYSHPQNMLLGVFTPPAGHGFGDHAAIGNFTNTPGLEVAIALTPSGVAVFNEAFPTARYVLGSGRAVATDPAYIGGLDALLVGTPGDEAVRRWVGDAAVMEWSLDGGGTSEFGYAVAARAGARAVGAPGLGQGAGAVFVIDGLEPVPLGTPLDCSVGSPCSRPTGMPGLCQSGACLGGVICQAATLACPVGYSCFGDVCVEDPDGGSSGDAGQADAGTADAGADDAGADDAGADDAGTSDAGARDGGLKDGGTARPGDGGALTADFVAIGCPSCASVTGGEVMLVAALGWLAARRRRNG